MTSKVRSPEDLMKRVVDEAADEDTVGFLLTGSYARDDATEYSDIDLIKFVSVLPDDSSERYIVKHHDDCLVTTTVSTVDAKLAEMQKPETAIWAVPGIRQAKVLLDRDGAISKLKNAADAFNWEPLREVACIYACRELAGLAEEAHKLIGGLIAQNASATLYATFGLVLGLTRVAAVRHGVMIDSENSYFRLVEETLGMESAWCSQHRIASGLDGETSLNERGIAAVRLYVETAELVSDCGDQDAARVIEATTRLIKRTLDEFQL